MITGRRYVGGRVGGRVVIRGKVGLSLRVDDIATDKDESFCQIKSAL